MAAPLPKTRIQQKPYTAQKRRLSAVKPVKKRINPFKYLVQLIFIAFIGYFVMPVMYNDFLSPIFLNRYFYRAIQSEKIAYQPLNIKAQTPTTTAELYFNPVASEVYNTTLLGKNLISSFPKNKEMTPITLGSQMLMLSSDLKTLASKYPKLKPSIFVWDYATAQYVDINSEDVIPSASIIKIPILLELFRQIEEGQKGIKDTMLYEEIYRSGGSGVMFKLPSDVNYTLDELANLMITESDNTATNMLLTETGGRININRVLRNWGFNKTQINSWLPDLSGTNMTTARDISTMLYNLDSPSFLNLQSKEYIVDYMSRVKNVHLLQAGLGKGAAIVHKTGDIGTMLGDAGIVYTPSGRKYIAVIMVQRPHNDYGAKDFIVEASSIIYKTFEPSKP